MTLTAIILALVAAALLSLAFLLPPQHPQRRARPSTCAEGPKDCRPKSVVRLPRKEETPYPAIPASANNRPWHENSPMDFGGPSTYKRSD